MSYKVLYISVLLLLNVGFNGYAQTPEEIYKLNQALIDTKDSLRASEKWAAVANIEKKYNTAEKDKRLIEQQILLNRKKNEVRRKDLFLIVGCGFLVLAISSLIVGYRNYRHKLKLDAKELQKRRQQLEIENLNTMMLAEEKERLQLAKSIQTGIAQKLKLLNKQVLELPDRYVWLGQNAAFKEVEQQMKATELELKQTTQNLVPDIILDKGIYKAVVAFCNSLHQSTGLTITCLLDSPIPGIEAEVEISLYRIIQELIQNIIKHANASIVSVLFNYKNGMLAITINDNGIGFANSGRKTHEGIGLKNIDMRIKALGGSIATADNSGGGVTTHITLPLLTG